MAVDDHTITITADTVYLYSNGELIDTITGSEVSIITDAFIEEHYDYVYECDRAVLDDLVGYDGGR